MVVLDSSFLIAFHNERDVHHAEAAELMVRLLDEQHGPLVLLEYVFLEVITVLRHRLDHGSALAVGDLLLHSREIEFMACSDLFLEALEVFRFTTEASLSFADAAIVAAARRNPPGHVATFDSDFRSLRGVTPLTRA